MTKVATLGAYAETKRGLLAVIKALSNKDKTRMDIIKFLGSRTVNLVMIDALEEITAEEA